jgi:hypothetical protein
MKATRVEDVIASGQLRPSETLIDLQGVPGTLAVLLAAFPEMLQHLQLSTD